jgi:ribosomal protein L16 Arg81 hydroxylase
LEKLHEQYSKREKLLDRFGGAKEARKARETVLSDEKMKRNEEIYDDMKEFWPLKLKAAQHAKVPAQLRLDFNSEHTMLAHFEDWYKKESTLLFGDVDEKNVGKFLAQWNVQFAGEC